MRQVKQSTARTIVVLVVLASDRDTGATGQAGSMTIQASKNGGAFATITPTITERGRGHYAIALTSGHTDTVGDLVLDISCTLGAPVSVFLDVVASTAADAVTAADDVLAGVGAAVLATAWDDGDDVAAGLRDIRDALVGRTDGYNTTSPQTIHIKNRTGAKTRRTITTDATGRTTSVKGDLS